MTPTLWSRWLTRVASVALIPAYVLAVSTRTLALSIPIAAEVSRFQNTSSNSLQDQIYIGRFDNSERQPIFQGFRLFSRDRFLKIPGNQYAQANLRYVFDDNSNAQLGVQAGPAATPSSYYFPCRFEGGTFVVGWSAGTEGRPCANPGITVSLGSSGQQAELPQPIALQTTSLLSLARTKELSAQANNPVMQYCTIAAKGRGWWVRWGNFEDPCQEALQACLATGPASGCTALGTGHWRAKDPDLLVTVGCADNRFYSARGNGVRVATTLISDLAQTAKAELSRVCALNVYQPDDIIIAPATEETTLIQTQDLGSSLAVDALAGDLLIRSTQQPDGLILERGHQYLSTQHQVQPIDVSAVAQSTPVRNFLDPANWPPESASDLEDYQDVLDDDPPEDASDGPGETDWVSPLVQFLVFLGLSEILDDDNGDRPPPQERTARIELSSRSLNFGRVDLYERESERLTITNIGSAPLRIGDIDTNSNVFTPGEQCWNVSLEPDDRCTLSVYFEPPATQEYTGNLVIPSNAENGVQTVKLSGTGVYTPPYVE